MGNAAAIDAGATEKIQLEICSHNMFVCLKVIFKPSKLDKGYVPGYCSSLHCSD